MRPPLAHATDRRGEAHEAGVRDDMSSLHAAVGGGRRVSSSVAAREHYPVRKTTLEHQGADDAVRRMTAAERIAMVWTLSVQAWQFKEPGGDEPRLRRHVVRVVRGRG
jgi:hypothetical protein